MGNYISNYNSDLHTRQQGEQLWLATGQEVVCTSHNLLRKGRGSRGLNFRANIGNLPPPAAGRRGREGTEGGSKQELVKSLIVLQSVSTVLTEAGAVLSRSGWALLRRIQNEGRRGECFITKQQQDGDSERDQGN